MALLLLLPSIRNRLKLKGWTTWVGINRRHYCDHSISYLGRNCVKYLCTPSMQQSLLRRKKRPAVLKWYIFRNLATTIGDGSFLQKSKQNITGFQTSLQFFKNFSSNTNISPFTLLTCLLFKDVCKPRNTYFKSQKLPPTNWKITNG